MRRASGSLMPRTPAWSRWHASSQMLVSRQSSPSRRKASTPLTAPGAAPPCLPSARCRTARRPRPWRPSSRPRCRGSSAPSAGARPPRRRPQRGRWAGRWSCIRRPCPTTRRRHCSSSACTSYASTRAWRRTSATAWMVSSTSRPRRCPRRSSSPSSRCCWTAPRLRARSELAWPSCGPSPSSWRRPATSAGRAWSQPCSACACVWKESSPRTDLRVDRRSTACVP
mmetsp:Transcript_128047/g.410320  ORF Transcript_128047/g.410320 Transcript_128047/m.410320 type:complete len:226 (-) Transcript_128047:967-1644(-)